MCFQTLVHLLDERFMKSSSKSFSFVSPPDSALISGLEVQSLYDGTIREEIAMVSSQETVAATMEDLSTAQAGFDSSSLSPHHVQTSGLSSVVQNI